MNLFQLHEDQVTSVQYHCDKHVVKMPSEAVQICCTVVRKLFGRPGYLVHPKRGTIAHKFVLPGERRQRCFLTTHPGHPLVVWAGASRDNFAWTVQQAYYLFLEYEHRYQRRHASWLSFEFARSMTSRIPEGPATQAPACLGPNGDLYADPDIVVAYRSYYRAEKARFARYTNRSIPPFMEDLLCPSSCT